MKQFKVWLNDNRGNNREMIVRASSRSAAMLIGESTFYTWFAVDAWEETETPLLDSLSN
jgi:hypothetical protein